MGKTVSRQIFVPEPPNAAKAANKKRQPLSAGDAGSELPATIPNAELSARRQAMQGPRRQRRCSPAGNAGAAYDHPPTVAEKTGSPSEELRSQTNWVPNDCKKRIGSRWVAIASTGNPLRSEAKRVHEQEFEEAKKLHGGSARAEPATKENLFKNTE